MQMLHESFDKIGTRIAGSIDALAAALPRCTLARVVEQVDEIRRLAHDHGFIAVEALASRLESSVAAGGQRAAVLAYLDAMHDAAAVPRGAMPPSSPEAWLAAVAMRLGA